MGETIKASERVVRMKDDLGLEPVIVELGNENDPLIVDWVIWPPDDEVEEEDVNYIKREILSHLRFLEEGHLSSDEEVFDDFADLIALQVLLYEELVADVNLDHVEHNQNKMTLAYYRSFFESDQALEDCLWTYANGRADHCARMMFDGKARRWALIREIITRRICVRLENWGDQT